MCIVLPIYGFVTLDKYSICFTKVHWWLSLVVAVSATLLYLNYMHFILLCMECTLYCCSYYVGIAFELSLLFLTLDVFCLCHMWIYYSIHTVEDKAEKSSYEHPLVEL